MASLNTRLAIRRRAGRLCGDMLLCKATANGSTTTFTDTLNLNHEQSILVNRQGIFSGGATTTNYERIVRVESSAKATQTLTFTPAVPTATAITDELELWNQRDEGATPELANDIINDCIKDATEHAPVPVTSDTFTFDADSPIIDIDELELDAVVDGTNWEVVTGVDWRPATDDDDVVYHWRKVDTADLSFDRYARTITITGRHAWLCDDNEVRVRGANLPAALTSDTATTPVNFEWLTHQVAAQILSVRLEKAYDRKDVKQQMDELQRRADLLRPKLNLRLKGRFWRLT